jgi:double-stranded uracil-DNA glycosylase
MVPDVIAPRLSILFSGINPGLYTAWAGHHFGRPGNRFWRVLHSAGFTERVLDPGDQRDLLRIGLGITNLVERATARADELTVEELRTGGRRMRDKVTRWQPRCLAVLGVSAYRVAFEQPHAAVGRQPHDIGATMVWVLPNPSGLNAHYQLPELAAAFEEVRRAVAG